MSDNALKAAIKEHDAKFVDLRFTDPRGKEQHITLPVSAIDDDFFENGKIKDRGYLTTKDRTTYIQYDSKK